MDLGGPVWHASVRSLQPVGDRTLRRMSATVLEGVGDPRLGEWFQRETAMHHRRRLSIAEEAVVGPVVDVRGTDEARRRAVALGDLLRLVPDEILVDEIGRSGAVQEENSGY